MKAYYKATITKQPIGSAILHKEPPLQGEIVTKVTDMTTAGDNKIIVMECSDQEHQFNLARSDVVELEEAEASKLAAKYQPTHEETEINPRTLKEEKIKRPAFDLAGFLKQHDKLARPRSEAETKIRPR